MVLAGERVEAEGAGEALRVNPEEEGVDRPQSRNPKSRLPQSRNPKPGAVRRPSDPEVAACRRRAGAAVRQQRADRRRLRGRLRVVGRRPSEPEVAGRRRIEWRPRRKRRPLRRPLV